MQWWYRMFVIGTFAAAATWGSASLFLFPTESQVHQMVFFLVMTGLAAAAATSLCAKLFVETGFTSLVLFPLAFRMFAQGDGSGVSLGVLVILFWCTTFVGARKTNRNIGENIKLHLENIEREKIFKISEERYRHIFNNAPLGIFQYDVNTVIVDCNNVFVSLLGISREKIIGINILEQVKEEAIKEALRGSLSTGDGYFEGDYTSQGRTIPIRAFFKAVRSGQNSLTGGVCIVEDFTEKKFSEQQIQYQATYDSLTGLPNRRLLLTYLKNEIARATRHGHFGALLFIDLDHFKTINDSLGHFAGDELLKVVAARITESIRVEDIAARMGGDEFIITLTELGSTLSNAANRARMVAEELSLCLSSPCRIEGQKMHITPSIGISIFPDQDVDCDDILKQADTAMYMAKAAGRNAIRLFLPSMQAAVDERLRISTELREALNKDEFSLYYQPQVGENGNIIGAEALLRWQHPHRGIISPAVFLPVAEETGVMWDIGRWVIHSACRQIKQWADIGQLETVEVISINISGKEFAAPDFVENMIDCLKETGVPPGNLGIELTEGSLISTAGDVVEKIMALRKLGITFSVDDFGTGYSSLSYLKTLPLHTLKIDQTFVRDIGEKENDVVLVDTIIMMAQNLGMKVVAEGVETEQQLTYLRSKGCNIYQGYYFSRPVAVDEFSQMLASGKSVFGGQQ